MMSKDSNCVLLCRPNFETAKTMINVFEDTICLGYVGRRSRKIRREIRVIISYQLSKI